MGCALRPAIEARMKHQRLPPPTPEAMAHSASLSEHIRAEIARAGGRLGFDRYMDLALNTPGLGYYRGPSRRFGEEGDFVTAPELSPLFGRCVARQVSQILERLDGGEIFEAGAGSGRLCAQVLNAMHESGTLPERYLILEPGSELRLRQRETIKNEAPSIASRVAWIDDLPSPGFRGVVLANEVLDALPARRFQKRGDQALEAYVESGAGGFSLCFDAPRDDRLPAALARIESALGEPLASGYTSEIGPEREAWIATVAGRLGRGAVLLFDYGYPLREYFHPQRRDGTLACYYRHRVHGDPFFYPGLQDISVHVEFSGLCGAARAAGLEVAGFTTQAEFLLAAGLLDECRDVAPGSAAYVRLAGEIKRLTLPGEMGELIKVLALSRGIEAPLPGFPGRDLRDRL